jgi:DNA-binding MarR family transcriptional regulator
LPAPTLPRKLPSAAQRRMLEVLKQFRVVFKSIRRHYLDVERRSGLSGAQLWALSEVAARPGGLVGDLAHTLAVHQSTASNLTRRLEAVGLLRRQRRGRDQRRVQLFATRKGLELLRRAPRPLIGMLQQGLSDLPAASLRGLHEDLGALIKVMRLKSSEGRGTPLSEMGVTGSVPRRRWRP